MAFNTQNSKNPQNRKNAVEIDTNFTVRNVKVWNAQNASFNLDLPDFGITFYGMRMLYKTPDDVLPMILPQSVKGKDGAYHPTAFVKFSDRMVKAIAKEVGRQG